VESGEEEKIYMVYCLACAEHNWDSSDNLSVVCAKAEEEATEEKEEVIIATKKEVVG